MKEQLVDFYGNYADERETAQRIKEMYENTGYILDTHTAVASAVYRKYVQETGDGSATVIASTASPFKFTRNVMKAIDEKYSAMSDFGGRAFQNRKRGSTECNRGNTNSTDSP